VLSEHDKSRNEFSAPPALSVTTDPVKDERFGGAFEIKYMPPELQVIPAELMPGILKLLLASRCHCPDILNCYEK